jgi:hypothetical protein
MGLIDKSGNKVPLEAAAPVEGQEKTDSPKEGVVAPGDPAKPEGEQQTIFSGQINVKEGTMLIRVDMKRASEANELIDQFVGFMERHKKVGIDVMVAFQQQRIAQQKQLIKPGFRPSFIDKLRGKNGK